MFAAGDVNQRTKDSWFIFSLSFSWLLFSSSTLKFEVYFQMSILMFVTSMVTSMQSTFQITNWVQFYNTDACLFIAVFSITVTYSCSLHSILGTVPFNVYLT